MSNLRSSAPSAVHPSPASPAASPREGAPSPGAKVLRFRPASERARPRWLKMLLSGPSGSGKTLSGLAILRALVAHDGGAGGGKLACLSTEPDKVAPYAYGSGEDGAGDGIAFDLLELAGDFHPRHYAQAVRDAVAAGYDALLIDSLTPAWLGEGGMLERADQAIAAAGGDRNLGWNHVNTYHREMMAEILTAPLHVVATVRAKTEVSLERVPGPDGRTMGVRRAVGLLQREGIEYDFPIGAEMTAAHELRVQNSVCRELSDKVFPLPGDAFAGVVRRWLAAPPVAPASAPASTAPPGRALGTVNGMTLEEDRAMRDIDPALREAATPEDVEALRVMAVQAMPVDPANPSGQRLPSAPYAKWYQAAFRAARIRVTGRP